MEEGKTKSYRERWRMTPRTYLNSETGEYLAEVHLTEIINGGAAADFRSLDVEGSFRTKEEAIEAGYHMAALWIDNHG